MSIKSTSLAVADFSKCSKGVYEEYDDPMSNITTSLLLTQIVTKPCLPMFRQHHGDVDQRPQVQLPEQGLRRRRAPARQHQRLVLGRRKQEVGTLGVVVSRHTSMSSSDVDTECSSKCHVSLCLLPLTGLCNVHTLLLVLIVRSTICFCSGVSVHCSNLQLVT